MIKDKQKPLKEINDCTNIKDVIESDLNQCPYCKHLFTGKHKCNDDKYWYYCTICGVNLQKDSKRGHFFGRSKKHYRIISSRICHQCACNIAKELKT